MIICLCDNTLLFVVLLLARIDLCNAFHNTFFGAFHHTHHKTVHISPKNTPRGTCASSSLLAVGDEVGERDESPLEDVDVVVVARRRLVRGRRSFARASFVAAASLATAASPAAAVKGAAEYDLEYYWRDLVRGNAREGSLPASAAPAAPPPRVLAAPLVSVLVAAPVRALSEVARVSEADVSTSARAYRERSARSFAARAQWERADDLTDQYWFDLSSYALWRAAADAIPTDYARRAVFAREVGREILRRGVEEGIFTASSTSPTNDGGGVKLTRTMPAVEQTLDAFRTAGFCARWRVGGEDADAKLGGRFFDELDDEDLEKGRTVDCLVSVYDPATLGAALQITGEGSRFAPDYVGCTLAAVWERYGVKATFETYFVDPVYRPNPKDYFPDEQLYQFSLSKI